MGKELQKCEKSENILHHNMGDESAYSSEIHVLAVDDSNIDRKVIERLLKTSSFKVTAVDSALRALEVLGVADGCTSIATNAYHINLIITDYCMPDMAGYDLLKRVKEVSSLREIPVVIMSSENVPNRIKRCLEEGAEEFIIKPVRLADVKRLRRHVVKQTNCHEEENIAPAAPCFKRKLATDTQQIASSERRTRPRGLTVP